MLNFLPIYFLLSISRLMKTQLRFCLVRGKLMANERQALRKSIRTTTIEEKFTLSTRNIKRKCLSIAIIANNLSSKQLNEQTTNMLDWSTNTFFCILTKKYRAKANIAGEKSLLHKWYHCTKSKVTRLQGQCSEGKCLLCKNTRTWVQIPKIHINIQTWWQKPVIQC